MGVEADGGEKWPMMQGAERKRRLQEMIRSKLRGEECGDAGAVEVARRGGCTDRGAMNQTR